VPTAHRFFNDAGRSPASDILFYTELGRQASLAVSHAFLGVGSDDVFIFEQSHAAMVGDGWRSRSRSASDTVVVEVRTVDVSRRKNGAVTRVVAEHRMSVAGDDVFRGTGAWSMQPAALFQRLRRMSGARTPAPADGAALRRRGGSDNVVIHAPEFLEAGACRAELIVDPAHPYFFDHPCDHVPGMLLLEGCAQVARACRAGTGGAAAVSAYTVNFAQFVECGLPAVLTARPSPAPDCGTPPPDTLDVAIAQDGVVAGTAVLTVVSAR
jgi:hypothetical protein